MYCDLDEGNLQAEKQCKLKGHNIVTATLQIVLHHLGQRGQKKKHVPIASQRAGNSFI